MTKKRIHPAISAHYRELQKKSRESYYRNLIARAEKLKKEGLLTTSDDRKS